MSISPFNDEIKKASSLWQAALRWETDVGGPEIVRILLESFGLTNDHKVETLVAICLATDSNLAQSTENLGNLVKQWESLSDTKKAKLKLISAAGMQELQNRVNEATQTATLAALEALSQAQTDITSGNLQAVSPSAEPSTPEATAIGNDTTSREQAVQSLIQEIENTGHLPLGIRTYLISEGWMNPQDVLKLRDQLQNAKTESEQQRNVFKQKQDELNALQEQMTTSTLQLEELNNQIASLTNQLTQVNTQLHESKGRAATELQNTKANLEKRITELNQKIQTADKQRISREEQIAILREEITSLTLQKDTLNHQVTALQTQIEQLQQSVQQPRDSVEPMTGRSQNGTTAPQDLTAETLRDTQGNNGVERLAQGEEEQKFRLLCDKLFGEMKEGEPTGRAISPAGKQEGLASFLPAGKSELTTKPGLGWMYWYMYGQPLPDMDTVTFDMLFENLTPDKAKEIGQTIDHLEKSDGLALEIITILRENFSARFKYFLSYFSTEVFNILSTSANSMLSRHSEFYFNLPKFVEAIRYLLSAVDKLPNSSIKNGLLELKKQIQSSELLPQLDILLRSHPDTYTDSYEQDLKKFEINGKQASNILIDTLSETQNTSVILQLLELIGTITPLALIAQARKSSSTTANPPTRSKDNTISVTGAKNPLGLNQRTSYDGNLPPLHHFGIYSTNWPPSVYCKNYNSELAIQREMPISFELRPQQPIHILTGNNGSGKTRGMETLSQVVTEALTTNLNTYAEVVKLSDIVDVRTLVGSSAHSQELSSFQRESILIANALEGLVKKDKGQYSILMVDEVGKGTDSRDAIALMIAIAEFCRRNNIYLIMATHFGDEFVQLAEKLGLKQYIRIFAPNYDTREIEEHEQVISSKGVEMMEERVKLAGATESPTIQTIINNAKKIRQAVVTGSDTPILDQAPERDSAVKANLQFVDPESLKAVGIDPTGYDNVNFNIRPVFRKEIDYHTRRAWEKLFVESWKKLTDLNPDERDLQIETNLEGLVRLIENDPSFLLYLEEALRLYVEFLIPAEIPPVVISNYEKILQGPPDRVYIDSSFRDKSAEFVNKILDINKFELISQIGHKLISSGVPSLELWGNRLIGITTVISKLETVIKESRKEASSVFKRNLLLKAAQGFVTMSKSEYKQLSQTDLKELAHIVGIANNNLLSEIATRLESGNWEVYMKVFTWLKQYKDKNPDNDSDPKDSLWSSTTMNGLGEVVKKIAIDDLSQEKVIVGLANNDFESFLKGIQEVQSRNYLYGVTDQSRYVVGLAQDLNGLLYFRWLQVLEEAENVTDTDSHYRALGLAPGATMEEIKIAFRQIARDNHEDQIKLRHRITTTTPKRDLPDDIRHEIRQGAEKIEAAQAAQSALKKLTDEDQEITQIAATFKALKSIPFLASTAEAIIKQGWSKPATSNGRIEVGNGLPLGLLNKMSESEVARQSLEVPEDAECVIIGGNNGGGKTQLLQFLASLFVWKKNTGFVPCNIASMPEVSFVHCMVNAGESQTNKSSFQAEIDSFIDLIKKYEQAGSPENGIIFVDEPLAGTSSEDQIGIMLAIVDYFRQRKVKLVFTNHNYKMYDYLRKMGIKFTPMAYVSDQKYQIQVFDPSDTDSIRSDGLAVAGEFGVPEQITQVALYARKILTGSVSV